MDSATSANNNRLLASLSAADLDQLLPHFTHMDLKLNQDLERPNKPIDYVYFPDAGIASVVAVQNGEQRAEIGLIGCEGMTGIAVLLGGQSSPHSTYMQVSGEGHRIPVAALRNAMGTSATLHMGLLKYVQVFMLQTAHTAVANVQAKLDARLARWILMAQDRITGPRLPLTHEFLALMLGVRRPGVTEALQKLSDRQLIRTGRGEIVVLDRKGIERLAGALYGAPETEYRRLIQSQQST